MRLLKLIGTRSTSQTVAFASAASFGTQVVFALLMLRLFTPQEVGAFSVISQIAFFWMTLALAQAPLTFLANAQVPAHQAARVAWQSSALRGLLLLPVAALVIGLSHLAWFPNFFWIMAIAGFQMTWQLAQSFVLRTGTSQHQAAVRVLPPLCAALLALMGAALEWQGPTLVLSAMLGFMVGACWLLPAWRGPATSASALTAQTDNRSTHLRLLHTLLDALLATAILVVWQRLYGAEETGWMSALLRVFGFVPAVVHMAWAQVKLARHATEPSSPPNNWHVALLGCCAVLVLAVLCALALHWQWLSPSWVGVWAYLVPVALWQASACVSAAFSHRPFQANQATRYSVICMAVALLQALVLVVPALIDINSHFPTWQASAHMLAFAATSALGLLSLAWWMARLSD